VLSPFCPPPFARTLEEQEQVSKMMNYPYREFEAMPVWKVVDEAISDLIANQDIKETTARRYIVGYLVECLVEARLVSKGTEE
jgi:hypothetical protein